MNLLIATFLIASGVSGFVLSKTAKVTTRDMQPLTGVQWTGALTYLDYTSNKKVSIPSSLLVTQSASDRLSWVFEYRYPDEPHANDKETVSLSRDGKILNGERVIGRTRLADKTPKIVTEKDGMDNNKKSQ